jgi:hypothetical protein
MTLRPSWGARRGAGLPAPEPGKFKHQEMQAGVHARACGIAWDEAGDETEGGLPILVAPFVGRRAAGSCLLVAEFMQQEAKCCGRGRGNSTSGLFWMSSGMLSTAKPGARQDAHGTSVPSTPRTCASVLPGSSWLSVLPHPRNLRIGPRVAASKGVHVSAIQKKTESEPEPTVRRKQSWRNRPEGFRCAHGCHGCVVKHD